MIPELRLLIRVDADAVLGLGHVSRCLVIAQHLKILGLGVEFVVNTRETADCLDGYSVSVIGESAGTSDIEFLLERASLFRATCVLLDGYHFDEAYRQVIFDRLPLACFDDINLMQHLHADVIINANPNAHTMGYEKSAKSAELLLGLDYVLLPEAFLSFDRRLLPDAEKRNHILVCFGGSDPSRKTLPVLKELAVSMPINICVDVVCGPLCQDISEIEDFCKQSSFNFHYDCNDMAGLMANAGLAIAAPGSMLYELAYMGVPSVFLIVADNQKQSALCHHQLGWCYSFASTCSEKKLVETALNLWSQSVHRSSMSSIALGLFDATGGERIANALIDVVSKRSRTQKGRLCMN